MHALAPVDFADASHSCEELPFLVIDGDYSSRTAGVAAEIAALEGYAPAGRFAGMTAKEVRKAQAWLRWAANMAMLRSIHAEIDPVISAHEALYA